jgi:NAD(P)-dependent dehydrogenase (short-subunit alcohol dehydrogenase family)
VDRLAADVGEPVDVLVSNAGIMDHFVPVTELDDATWDRVLAVNLTAVMRLCRAFLPAMRRTGGAVVNVVSIGGLTGAVAGTA